MNAPQRERSGRDGLPILDAERDLPHLAHAEAWLDEYRDLRGGNLKPSREITGDAMLRARFYVLDGTAYTALQPGDGTKYTVIVHDLLTIQAGALREKYEGTEHALTLEAAREKARTMGPAGICGGEILVAMPENRGGRSAVFGAHGPYVPWYVDDRLAQGEGGSRVIAAWLTTFCDAVLALRGDA